jgi:hypothetical protein
MKRIWQVVVGLALSLALLAPARGQDAKGGAPAKSGSGAGEKEPLPTGLRDLSPQHPAVVLAKERAARMREVEDELRVRLKDYEMEGQKLREEMRAANGGRPVEGLRDAVAGIQRDATRLRIDLAGMEARKQVVEQAIESARKAGAKRASQTDVLSGQLAELVKLQEESLKRVVSLYKTGNVGAADMDKAKVELGEARVKLLDREQAVLREGGGTDVSKLTDQLTNLSASLIETQARLRAMDEVLTTYEKLQRLMDQEQEVRWQVGKLRGMVEHVERVRLDERLGVPRRGAE